MKKLLLFIALIISGLGLNAQKIGDYAIIEYEGYSLKYKVTSVEPAECDVQSNVQSDIPVTIVIPSEVEIKGLEFTVTSIKDYAFLSCDSIIKIEIPSGVTFIGEGAFKGCSSLTSIEIPNGVTSIGAYAFHECSFLASIVIPEGVTSIGAYAFYKCSSLASIVIPEGVTSIGNSAFYKCSSLASIVIPEGVASIGNSTFRECSSLASIVIPSGVTSIGWGAFLDCSNLKSIEIPESVTSIDTYAFADCNSLTRIELPNSVTSIGDFAFHSCDKLNLIICFMEDIPELGSSSFKQINNNEIYFFVPEELVESYKDLDQFKSEDYIVLPITLIPDNLNADIYGNSVVLSWNITVADSYNVYIGNDMIENVPTNFCLINGLKPSTDYCFSVKPIYKGVGMDRSDELCVRTQDMKIPSDLTVTVESSSAISLNWSYEDEVLIYEDFENYQIGDRIAQKSDNGWTTWSGKVGLSEDAKIAELNGNKCLHIVSGNDQVLLLGDSIFEHCEIELDIFVPDGKSGYFNILHDFDGSNSVWAMQSFLHITDDGQNNTTQNSGHGTVHAGGNSIADIPAVYDEWMHFRIFVDIEKDKAQLYYKANNEEILICEWQWSKNSFGDESGYVEEDLYIRRYKLAAMNFFSPLSTSEFYIDNIKLSNKVHDDDLSYNIYQGDSLIANVASNMYSVNDLESYTEYCFTVTAVRNETESDKSESACARTFDLPITTPENVIAEAISTSSISLTWDEVENALSYNVYQGEEIVANVAINSYEVNNLNYYTDYCFTVTAVRNETESDKSESACAKTFDLPITTPANLVAEATSTSSISLIWDEVENALSYNIYQGENIVANVTTNSYLFENLNYYTDYCFTVTAVRNETETEKSESACAKTFDLPIVAPTNFAATPINTTSIILTWKIVENALSYNVYQDNSLIANVASNMYSANDLESYTEYCFTVTAVRNETESDKSEEVCAKTMDLSVTKPEEVVVTPINTSSIIITWDIVENALSYNLYRDNELVENLKNTNYADTGLEYDTEYCYVVTAVRNETESDKSEEVCVKTLGEGVNEISASVNVYPIPVTDKLYIDADEYVEEVCIYTLSGVMIYREIDFDNKSIDVSNMNSGVYFVMIKTNDVVVTKRFVKE